MPSLLKMSAELGLIVTPFQAGLKRAESAAASGASAIGKHFKGLVAGYFGIQALEAAFKGVIGRMADIADQSDQFSITTDEVQKLGAAAEEVGLKFEDMGSALLKFNQARKAMNEGDQGKIDAANFFKLGQGAFAGSGKSSVNLMQDVANNLPDKIDERTLNHLAELFGKSGPRLVEALKKLREDGGPIISKEDIDSVDQAETAFRRLAREISTGAAPAVAGLSDAMVEYLKHLRAEADMDTAGRKKSMFDGLRRVPIVSEIIFGRRTDIDWDDFDAKEAASAKRMAEKRKRKADANKAAEGPAAEIVNPQKIAEVGEAQEKLRMATEKYAFGQLNKSGQIADLRKRIRDYDNDIATVQQFVTDGANQQLDKEQRIAELKTEQLSLMEQMQSLQKNSGDSRTQLEIYRYRGFGATGGGSAASRPAGSPSDPKWFSQVDMRDFKGAVGQFRDAIDGGKILKLGK